MRIIGICRFSYLATRGWQQTVAEDTETTATNLHARERMEERLRLFEALCLPSVLSQTDQDFKLLIIAASRMPQEWRDRLERLVAPHPIIRIEYLKPRRMAEAVTVALRRTVGKGRAETVVQFCLDDDDALSVNYVARLRRQAEAVMDSTFAENLPIAINHPRGITLSKQLGRFEARENHAPFLALGLALVTSGNIPTNVYVVPHLKTPTRIFSIADPKPMSFLRGLHDHHDSRGILKGRARKLDRARLQEILDAEFPFVTPEVLRDVFGMPTEGDEAPAEQVLRASGSSAG
jgi:hypothetical protein